MRLSPLGPLTVIRWGRRLVYVALLIAFIVAFQSLSNPLTLLFLGSVLCLIFPALFALKDERWASGT